MASKNIISITSLRGGMNNSDASPAIKDDEVEMANNVEFFLTPLGERRLGCAALDITGSGLELEDVLVFLGVHHPAQTDIINNEVWAAAATVGTSVSLARQSGNIWYPVVVTDTFTANPSAVGKMHSVALHGKFFVTGKSNANRVHVWDGDSFRRVGLAPPLVAPTASNTGGGSFNDIRYYRVRFTVQDADSKTILQSEPSPELTFTPSGGGAGATVTRPAVQDGNETHWQLEASSGDGNWYVIVTTPIATATAVDTIIPATSYDDFELSADIGDYTAPTSFKYVVSDQDRLIFAGNWEDPDLGSRVAWTPVFGATGVGNDERIPLDTDNYIDLDWMSDGDLTGISGAINGSLYAFKHSKIYKLQRSGNITNAYTAFLLSSTRGAIEGSIINGSDEYGGACVYFLDPAIGPCRIGSQGLQEMTGIRGTWQSVNVTATPITSHGVYYPDKQQVHWWVAVSGSATPNQKIICQVSEIRSNDSGSTSRCWALADGLMATAWCSTIVPEIVTNELAEIKMSFRPYIGMLNPDGLLRCDVGDTDNGTRYFAELITRPIMSSGLLGLWGIMHAAVLADSINAGTQMIVSLIRDFGREQIDKTVSFVPVDDETYVNVIMDDLKMSQAFAIQIRFADPPDAS